MTRRVLQHSGPELWIDRCKRMQRPCQAKRLSSSLLRPSLQRQKAIWWGHPQTLKHGQYLIWDFTSLARIRLPRSTSASLHWQQGQQHLWQSRKRSKYAKLSSSENYAFVPIAIVNYQLGAWRPSVTHPRCLSDGFSQAAVRHCIAIQRGNAAAVVKTQRAMLSRMDSGNWQMRKGLLT